MDFQKQVPYIGNLAQLFSVKEYRLIGGPADGVRAVDISNGAGLDITVIPDRCMDIYQIKYQNTNLNYITPSGVVSPSLFGSDAFLRRFFAGFLTTCGPENTGSPCTDEGEKLPLHGSFSSLKAENVSVQLSEEDGQPVAVIRGTMSHSVIFGQRLSLTREFRCKYGDPCITFTDTVTNHGFSAAPLMLLYHFNMGYPLLSETARLKIPTKKASPRDDYADPALWQTITPPAEGFREMCYYHDIIAEQDGTAKFGIGNPAASVGVEITYDRALLDHFVQWRMLGKGDYVMGLEPCNATINGRDKARADGSLKFIQPGESITYPFQLSFFSV